MIAPRQRSSARRQHLLKVPVTCSQAQPLNSLELKELKTSVLRNRRRADLPKFCYLHLPEITPAAKVKFQKELRAAGFSASLSVSSSVPQVIVIDDDFFRNQGRAKLRRRDRKELERLAEESDDATDVRRMIYDAADRSTVLMLHDFKRVVRAQYYQSADFHRRRQGLKKEEGNHVISLVRFAKKPPTRKSRYRMGGQIRDTELHRFHSTTTDLLQAPNVHSLELQAPRGVPIMLDRDEKLYLEDHADELEAKFLRKLRLSRSRKMDELGVVNTPVPPRGHQSCLVCFTRYDDFKEHVRSAEHLRNTELQEYKSDYALIDQICSELKSSIEMGSEDRTMDTDRLLPERSFAAFPASEVESPSFYIELEASVTC